jgi:hypothetical protein
MSRHSRSVEMVKQVIVAHQRLFVEEYLTDSSEIENILHQMIHSKLHHKSIKLYQTCWNPSFYLGAGTSQTMVTTGNKSASPPLIG